MNSVIRNFIAKALFKKKGVIANKKSVKFSANALEQRLKNVGVDPNDIKSENELNQILSFVKQAEDAAFDQRYRVIAADTLEGAKITNKLLGKKSRDVNIYSKQYIDNLDKEIIDSGLYTKKEWTNLSDELKEARRRKFDPNYDDAMEGTVESNVVDMTGKNIDTSQGIMGGRSVKELMDSGQVQKGSEGLKKSQKITNRDLFKDANQRLNKTDVDGIIKNIKKLSPMDAMKEANLVIGRKNYYKNLTPEESKKILQDTEDHIFERDIIPDPEDMADGGVAGLLGERTGFANGTKNKKITRREEDMGPYYETNDPDEALKEIVRRIINVEPAKIPLLKDMVLMFDLDRAQIGGQKNIGGGELSFGINKGFGRDDTGIGFNFKKSFAQGGPARQNFKMGKRAFLKLMGGVGAGIASLKSGLLGFGKGATKKAVTETIKQSAGSGTVPPYFLNLVSKIKNLGDDAPRLATKDRDKVTTYKDYTLTEDVTTGEQTIQRMKVLDDGSESYYGKPLTEETYMSYKPGKGQADEMTKGKTPPDEYEEGTALLRNDKEFAGEVVDESATISDDVIKEGTMFEDTIAEFGKTKKADGGIARMLGE